MQGSIFLLISIALLGYVFLTNTLEYKYRVPKYQGHHLVYRALTTGLVFYFIAFLIMWMFSSYIIGLNLFILTRIQSSGLPSLSLSSITLALQFTMSFLIVLLGIVIHNRLSIKKFIEITKLENANLLNNKTIKRKAQLYWYLQSTDSEFISHFAAPKKTSTILITLRNNRCYVAIPHEFKTPRSERDHQELSIIPLVSGYRDKNDMCLELTTDYEDVIDIVSLSKEEFRQEGSEKIKKMKETLLSYRITFPLTELTTLSTFDLSQYQKFKDNESLRKKEINSLRKKPIVGWLKSKLQN